MFQPWFVELIGVLSDICVGISAIVVAVLGFIGLRQWRKELTGKSKFDIARRMAILLSVLEMSRKGREIHLLLRENQQIGKVERMRKEKLAKYLMNIMLAKNGYSPFRRPCVLYMNKLEGRNPA